MCVIKFFTETHYQASLLSIPKSLILIIWFLRYPVVPVTTSKLYIKYNYFIRFMGPIA